MKGIIALFLGIISFAIAPVLTSCVLLSIVAIIIFAIWKGFLSD